MIPITKITISHNNSENTISTKQLKGAFTDYLKNNLHKKLNKKNIEINIAFNRDKDGKPLTRYSLIQYHTYKNHLEIVGIATGSKMLKLWLKTIIKNKDFAVNGKTLEILNIASNTQYWFPKLQNKAQSYKINRWKPFNSNTLADENKFDKIIWGNIHRMLSDLNIEFKEKVKIDILDYKKLKAQKGYTINWLNYKLIFTTNINLPQHIGIGHEISLGSGKITKARLI